MFYYYGAKKALAAYYPNPRGNRIIEPFGGSAAYSVYHMIRDNSISAVVIEKDIRVVELWNRLLSIGINGVKSVQCPPIGEKTTDYFVMVSATGNAVNKCKSMTVTKRMPRIFEIMKKQVCIALPIISDRIKVINGNYTESLSMIESNDTVFVDAPYAPNARGSTGSVYGGGKGYAKGCDSDSLNYFELANYVLECARKAHVIVCDYSDADWLSFQVLKKTTDSQKKGYQEGIWSN